MAVYDDQNQPTPEGDDAQIPHTLGDITGHGAGQPEPWASPSGGTAENLANQEGAASKPPTDPWGNPDAPKDKNADAKAMLAGAGLSAAEIGSVFNPKDTYGPAARVRQLIRGNRRAGAITGGVTSIVLIGFLGITILSGPAQIIQFGTLLEAFHFSAQNDNADSRMMNISRFVYYAKDKHLERTRLGILGNKYADRIELRLNAAGFKSTYSDVFGLDRGLAVDTKEGPYKGLDDQQITEKLINEKGLSAANISIDSNHNVTVNIADRGFVKNFFANKKFLSSTLRDTGFGKIRAWMGTRIIAKRRGFTLHPLKAADSKVLSKFEDWLTRNSTDLSKGDNFNATASSDAPPENADGTPNPEAAPAATETGAASDITKQASTVGAESIRNPSAFSTFTHSIGFKIAGGISAAAGVLCLARGLAENADQIKDVQVVAPAERAAAKIFTTKSQIQSGQDISMTDLAYASQMLHDNVSPTSSPNHDTSWASAVSIQAELGAKQTGPKVDSTLQTIGSGSPFDFLLNGGALGALLKPACSAVGQALTMVVSFVGGPISTGFGFLVSTLVGPDVENTMAHWLAGKAIDPTARGAALGDIANYGAKMVADEAAAAAGGVPMSKKTLGELKASQVEDVASNFKDQSLAYKLFNPYDSQSAVGQMLNKQDPSISGNVATVASGILNFGQTLASTIGHLGSIKASAAASATPYDYGTPTFGFSPEEMSNPIVDNPFQNSEAVANLLDGNNNANNSGEPDYIARASKCFGATISNSSGAWDVTYDNTPQQLYGKDYRNVEADCLDASQAWLRIRFFIFDTQTMKSEACYEGSTQSCTDMGLSTDGGPSSAGPNIGQTGWPYGPGVQVNIIQCFTWNLAQHSGHPGLDLDGPPGTPIYAITGGTAKLYNTLPGNYGPNFVVINPTDPTQYGSSYGHMNTATVKDGQTVNIGDQVGTEGTLGDSTGPHLHLNLFPGIYSGNDGPNIDPFPALKMPADATNSAGCH